MTKSPLERLLRLIERTNTLRKSRNTGGNLIKIEKELDVLEPQIESLKQQIEKALEFTYSEKGNVWMTSVEHDRINKQISDLQQNQRTELEINAMRIYEDCKNGKSVVVDAKSYFALQGNQRTEQDKQNKIKIKELTKELNRSEIAHKTKCIPNERIIEQLKKMTGGKVDLELSLFRIKRNEEIVQRLRELYQSEFPFNNNSPRDWFASIAAILKDDPIPQWALDEYPDLKQKILGEKK